MLRMPASLPSSSNGDVEATWKAAMLSSVFAGHSRNGCLPVRNRVMPFMTAVIKGVKIEWLSVKKRAVKPKLMFIRPKDSQTASKAASRCCNASKM